MILDLSMLQLYKIIFISFVPIIFINDDTGAVQTPSLKQVFNSKFKIGVALNKNQIRQRQQKENELIKREFSSLTAENVMKWEEIHPKKDRYNFKTPDLLVSLSQDNLSLIHI